MAAYRRVDDLFSPKVTSEPSGGDAPKFGTVSSAVIVGGRYIFVGR